MGEAQQVLIDHGLVRCDISFNLSLKTEISLSTLSSLGFVLGTAAHIPGRYKSGRPESS